MFSFMDPLMRSLSGARSVELIGKHNDDDDDDDDSRHQSKEPQNDLCICLISFALHHSHDQCKASSMSDNRVGDSPQRETREATHDTTSANRSMSSKNDQAKKTVFLINHLIWGLLPRMYL